MLDLTQAEQRSRVNDSPETSIDVLDQIAEPVSTGSVMLKSGRRVDAESGPTADILRVRGRGGEVTLTVLLTDSGPVLQFEAADLDIKSAGRVSVTCDHFELRAKEGIAIDTDGFLTETVRGDATRTAGGRAKQEAANVEITANPGTVLVRANDDVDVKGERIRLNCDPAPMARSWDEFVARLNEDRSER